MPNILRRFKGLDIVVFEDFWDVMIEPKVCYGSSTDCLVCLPRHLDYPYERNPEADDENCSWQAMYHYLGVSE